MASELSLMSLPNEAAAPKALNTGAAIAAREECRIVVAMPDAIFGPSRHSWCPRWHFFLHYYAPFYIVGGSQYDRRIIPE